MDAATIARFILVYFGPAYYAFLIFVLILAALNVELQIRRRYVNILLKIFEFVCRKIEKSETQKEEVDEQDITDFLKTADKLNNGQIINTGEGMPLKEVGDVNLEAPLKEDQDEKSDDEKKRFELSDVMDLVRNGIQSIVDDEVTKRFDADEIPSWNLLTRTNKNYQFISLRLSILWYIGFVIRYFILMPARVSITFMGVSWLVICTGLVGCVPNGKLKRRLYHHVSLMCFRILSRGISAVVRYHNTQYKAQGGGICVANHTSPIDVVILACDNCYALVGQRQGGFLGVLQRALGRATSHVWFERFETNDRRLVVKRLKEHVDDPTKLPILIFPEGTCINNSAVMQFKKGTFEVASTIYPVAIKYDQRFGDPFWNSSRHGYMHYLLLMMTSWAIVCDVWYLPPMNRMEGETAIDFASRVKGEIARQGGLVDLDWDGQLKRVPPKAEQKKIKQEEFSRRLKLE